MRKFFNVGLLIAMGAVMAACGVPREAAVTAAAEASATMPADDDAVRQQLIHQDAAWTHVAALLQQREFGGITGIHADFTDLVNETAAVAKRQHALIDQHQDDRAFNRQSLERFERLWQSANQYLHP